MPAYPLYVPDYQIRINGQKITPALRASIVSVQYTDGIEGADRVELQLINESLQWLDHPLLQVDNYFSLSIGYAPGPLEEVFVGEIVSVSPAFPSSGIPTISIAAQDVLHKLAEGTKDRAFDLNIFGLGQFPLPDLVVIGLTSVADLLIPYIDPVGAALSFLTLLVSYAIDAESAQKDIRTQQSQSDFAFLTDIAKDNGWEMFIDHTMEPKGFVLRFMFPTPGSTSVKLQWGRDLIDFTPRVSTIGQIASVHTRLWIPAVQMELVISLGWDYDRAAFNLMIYPGFGDLGLDDDSVRIDASGIATAPKQILTELLPRLNNRLTASGSTVGNPAIKASRIIEIDGVGEQFGGQYRITTATHSIDSGGYHTSFEARKEVWFGSIPLPTKARAPRLAGQAFG